MQDQGGWLWALVDGAFVVVLAVALVYGIFAWRRRDKSRAVEDVRDRATLRNYDLNPPGNARGG